MPPGAQLPLVSVQLPSLRAGCGVHRPLRRFLLHQQAAVHRPRCRTSVPTPSATPSSWRCSRSRPTIDKLLTELQDQINKINSDEHQLLRGGAGTGERRGRRVRQLGPKRLREHLPVPRQRHRPGRRLTCHQRAGGGGPPPTAPTPTCATPPSSGQRHWLALNQVGGGISQQEKELIAGVIGTVIPDPARSTTAAAPRHAIRRAHHRRPARPVARPRRPSHWQGNVDIEVYVCDEPAECLKPVAQPRSPPVARSRAWCRRAAAPHVRQHRHAQPQSPKTSVSSTTPPSRSTDAVGGERRAGLEHRRDPLDPRPTGRDRA